ncbi:hypothetical protein FSP39_017989 [Pinctada imbricata]|uniref:Uncharacterized protein n=1 Tax=Pinctada imbricata TaxID=66713 RepID=A0AA89C3K2_PINIB|nr:hypothetical protein FSP39_017989 [Pinctada imbricata]
MSRINIYLKRCTEDKDPIEVLRDEFFLRALSPVQAQWVRRNKGSSSVVEAAEDYIPPKIGNPVNLKVLLGLEKEPEMELAVAGKRLQANRKKETEIRGRIYVLN